MTRTPLFFLLLACLTVCQPSFLRAEQLTAEVTAYNKAALSGDVTDDMYAEFLNTAHRKGSVSKGDTAFLLIGGMPAGQVTGITAWVKSNKSAGAGSLAIMVDDQIVFSTSGTFDKWQGTGGYQTDFVPISQNGNWDIAYGGEIFLTIIGTANSIHFEKLVIDYQPAAPTAHCITFAYHTAQGPASISLCEQTVGGGILLPDLADQNLSRVEEWQMIGWSEAQLEESQSVTSAPPYTPVHSRYYPSRDLTLYPLYRYAEDIQPITQAVERQNGEYVIVKDWIDGFVMMTGAVSKKYVSSKPCNIAKTDGNSYRFLPEYVSAESRYQLDFENDSVTIYHPVSDSYIGHSANALSSTSEKWAVRECDNHSVCLYYGLQGDTIARTLMLRGDLRNDDGDFLDLFASVRLDMRKLPEMLLLFEVSSLPLKPSPAVYCTNPFPPTDLQESYYQDDTTFPVKLMLNGQTVVKKGIRYFDILGREIIRADISPSFP